MRLKSNARWLDLPGIEAVYQPIGAPSAVDALLNVAHDHRSVGKYTATPGVLPTWNAATGHTYNGTTQYLKTGIIPTAGFSAIATFWLGNAPAGDYPIQFGSSGTGATFAVVPYRGGENKRSYANGGAVLLAPALSRNAKHTMGIAGASGYLNGLSESGAISAWTGTSNETYIGTINPLGASQYFIGNIMAFLLASRTLTSAEMWLASRQMAYCEQNDTWNAWGRRRNYFYAPSAAAIRWPGVGRGGPVGGSPGIRGSQ